MIFISCTTGTVALYRRDDGSSEALQVEAWDTNGAPHVAGEKGLVAAAALPGFTGLEQLAVVVASRSRPVRQPVRSEPLPGRPPGNAPPQERGGPS